MLDFDRCDCDALAAVGAVVDALVDAGFPGDGGLMLVGAECRNLLHAALGHDGALRGTTDLDLAFMVSDWEQYRSLTSALESTGSSGVRFHVEGVSVDLVPFGPIENPTGTVPASSRSDALDVFAFDVVYSSAILLAVGDHVVRVPTPAGYTALKMKAWIDRSTRPDDRDGQDLAVCMYWYGDDPDHHDELYTEAADVLTAADFDVARALVGLLGSHVGSLLGETSARELKSLWDASDLTELGRIVGGERRRRGWPRQDDADIDVTTLGSGLEHVR